MPESPTADPGAPQPAQAAPAAPQWTVLCVDDEPNILSALRRLFRPAGYRVLVAEGGAQGLEILAKESVDLVISDMRMPHMDGAQFLKAVKEGWPDAVRMLLTGYADMASTIEAINQGEIYRYATKPWVDGDMLLTVRQALERKALEQEKKRLEALTQQQNEALRLLNESLEAKVLARTAELHQANEKLKVNFINALKIFTSFIELRHPMLAGHSRRVATLARNLSTKLGLDAKTTQNVFFAGMLHDIGKIGFPDKLLAKPMRTMTPDELVVYRKHPLTGEHALMSLEELAPATRFMRLHHERYDGLGFPDGLKGNDIPAGARILAVANDYDSLQIGTFSAQKFTPSEARQIMEKDRGKRYDPLVLDALFALTAKPPKPPSKERQVLVADLQPGMILTRDFVSREGALLLGADHELGPKLIEKMQEYQHSEGLNLTVYIVTRD